MPLKKRLIRRLFNLTVSFFIILVGGLSSYFYIAGKTRINALEVLFLASKDNFNSNLLNSISSGVSGFYNLFLLQLFSLLVIIISLFLVMLFLFRLYSVQRRDALVDELTRIYNKRAIEIALKDEIARAERFDHPLSVAVLDIDFFKQYNDTLGHVKGDILLRRFGRILKSEIREHIDMVGRIGGEEFLIIFPETSLKKARIVCERIRKKVANSRFYGEDKLPHKNVTVSIGVVEFEGGRKLIGSLVDLADKQLYRAKKEGRNKVLSE